MPARPVKFIRYCLTQWISKFTGSFEIHSIRQFLVNVILFWIKDLKISEMTVKLKSDLYVRPVNIFPNHAVSTKDFLNDCKTQKYIICQTCKCIPKFLQCKVIYTNWSQTQPQCTNVSIYKQLSTLEWDSSPHLTVWQHCNHFIAVLYLAAYPRRK